MKIDLNYILARTYKKTEDNFNSFFTLLSRVRKTKRSRSRVGQHLFDDFEHAVNFRQKQKSKKQIKIINAALKTNLQHKNIPFLI